MDVCAEKRDLGLVLALKKRSFITSLSLSSFSKGKAENNLKNMSKTTLRVSWQIIDLSYFHFESIFSFGSLISTLDVID